MVFRYVILLSALGIPAVAQDSGWNLPSSGLIFDPPTKSVRKITGFPGGAQLGEPIATDLDWASIAPNGLRAIGRRGSDLVWLEFLNRSEFPITMAADLKPNSASYLGRWSSDSETVRLYTGECMCFLDFRMQSSGQPAQSGAPSLLDSSMGAVSDFFWKRSRTVFSTGNGLYEIDGGAAPKPLLPSDSGLTFLLEGSGRAWGFRKDEGTLFEILLEEGQSPELRLLATDPGQLIDLSAVASMPKAVFVSDSQTRSVYQIAPDGRTTLIAGAMELQPKTLISLSDRPVWLIGERSRQGESVFLLDGTDVPQVFFVPEAGAHE